MKPLGMLALALVGTLGSSRALADASSLNDNLGPREVGVGEALRADARGALAITLNPAGLTLSRELVFEGSYGYRPGDGASSASVSACDSTGRIPGCYYYRYFRAAPDIGGTDYTRRSHELGMVLAYPIVPSLSLGVTSKYFDYNSDLMGEADASGFAFDFGATFRANDVLNLGVVGYNMVHEDTPQYPRAIGAGFVVRPAAALALAADGLWNLDLPKGDSTGRYGGGAEYFISGANMQSGYPLRLGGVYDINQHAGYITAGVGYMAAKVGIDVALRKQLSGEQMDGTRELMVTASIRVFGPRMAAQQVQPFAAQ